MSLWGWILLASAVAFATKLAGYLVPAAWLERPRATRMAAALTIGLLASLTAMNTFVAGTGLVIDARVGALLAAAGALALRVPFLGVVVIGAAATALLRLAGLP
ncbi:AzlD domain-containing protein [Luteimonas yindakuii]|uniref:AzlD domain-containing protein n=1 Tax=Luteimonas yindakuii TaxID=2565782 RepID=A0A4Z1R6B5_9GAMM|nr:AzlD domain-containing protein [Luteimonas yindakuii]QCU72315.1 AzlD domain-containing protein [Luteimonas yindakuii]TKS55204.1 AzlD domain-containing protein [Luteimonas yindakuii]